MYFLPTIQHFRDLFPRRENGGAKGKEMCSSCFRETGYCCIICSNPFCNRCSVFEEDEGSPGWVMGRSVAYCQTCYEEKQLTALNVTTSRCTADKSDISCISTPDDKEDQSTTDETSSISSLKRYVNEFEIEIDRLEDTVDWQQI